MENKPQLNQLALLRIFLIVALGIVQIIFLSGIIPIFQTSMNLYRLSAGSAIHRIVS